MADDDSYAGTPPPTEPIAAPPHASRPVHRAPPPPAQPWGSRPPQAYPQTGIPAGPPAGPKTNGLAIAGMILGILWIYWIGSILALIFGYVSKSQIERSNGRQKGRDLSTTAIVLGWVGVAALAVTIVVAIVVSTNDDNSLGGLLSPV